MLLVRLTYASCVTENFRTDDIAQILDSARRTNNKLNITGLLCFNRKFFLQCSEGSRSSVNFVYTKISADPRHHNLTLLEYKDISEREFGDWSMGYTPECSMTAELLLKYSDYESFDPYKMSGESAAKLLSSLRGKVPKV